MNCYVFSIGEKTTDLCCELMQEYGFDVVLYQDQTSLWEKLKRFYMEALESEGEWFVRIDADIIPNKNVRLLQDPITKWLCATGFDWYSQDRKAISIHVMHKDIIEKCLEHIEEAKGKIRPETYLWRHGDINVFTDHIYSHNFGLHGYGQKDQRDRIKELKHNRNQEYDWELLDRIEKL